jgi:hypothetical protein
MIEFLNAKATSYKITMSWIAQELNELQSERPKHDELINCLQMKLNECESLRNQLEIIIRVGHPTLVNRALPIIHDIELWIIIITGYYLPALRREDSKDSIVKNILISTASRCGLSWVKDFAVRLDGPTAIVSAIIEMPVIFSFPQHSTSLLNMAGLYHELGHNVFRKFPIIADHLAATVLDYFSEFRRQAGPLGPNEKAERDHTIDAAILYWNSKRLDELFADIFAVFVCGPARYYTCVDMAMSLESNPFNVNFMDEHPPSAARVFISADTLSLIHTREPSVLSVGKAWSACASSVNKNFVFDLVCSPNLLHRLVHTAITDIGSYLPQTPRYIRPLPDEVNMLNIPANTILEDILNQGNKILLTKPDSYGVWEKKVLDTLKS